MTAAFGGVGGSWHRGLELGFGVLLLTLEDLLAIVQLPLLSEEKWGEKES